MAVQFFTNRVPERSAPSWQLRDELPIPHQVWQIRKTLRSAVCSGMRSFRLIASACALALLACNGETENTYTDVGQVCLSGDPDAAHSVEIDFYVCMSSSCDSLVESSCEATLSGTELTITATATVASKGGACTADCQQLLVSCETDPLPAGTYDLIYGDQQGTLTVPAATAGEPTCVGGE
jgi:hypothetical protein